MIKDKEVKYVDLRFTDPRGKWQHVTFDVSMIDEDIFAEGTMFDGSSIAGWKAINESDMKLMPDPDTATIDPFFAADHAVIDLRRARADHRRALQPRPARHRQEGRGLSEVDRASATRSISARKPSSSSSTTCATRRRPVQHRLQARLHRAADQLRHRIREAAISATASARKGGYFPVPPHGLGAGHALARCSPRWRRWASRSRSTTTKSPPPSTSSA